MPLFNSYTPTIVTQQNLILTTVTGINAKTVTTTNLYTVPSTNTAVIIGAIVRCTAASSITIGPTASIGVTPSSYNDIFLTEGMLALTTSLSTFYFSSFGMFSQATASSVVVFNTTVGSTGTSQTLAVDLLGYLI